MKASELKRLLDAIPKEYDPDIVTGEVWLPERLLEANMVEDLVFLNFDTAPEEIQGEEEGRGFVDHEIELIRDRFEQILNQNGDTTSKADAMLALFLMGHELPSSEIIELLESPQD